jgi:cyanophycin synthetase
VTVRLAHDPKVSISAIDTWLGQHLDIAGPFAPFNPGNGDGPRELVAALAQRALGLYGELLGASYLTCFSGGTIVSVEPLKGRPGQFEVQAAIEVIDNIRPENFTATFREALRITQGLLGRYPGPQAAERTLHEIKSRVIDRLRKLSSLGHASETIVDVAYRQGIPFRHLGSGICRIGWGVNSCLLHDTVSEADSAVGEKICHRKHLTAHVLRSAGFPVPDHIVTRTVPDAIEAARTIGYPLVVKPASRERSEGVSVNITGEAELVKAFEAARALEADVLVERHIAGTTYRIQVVRGEVIYVVKRNPKRVTGDGTRTISQIADDLDRDAMRKPPWRRLRLWVQDEASDRELARQGFTRSSVLPDGAIANLRDIPSDEWGGVTELLTRDIHPENARLALDATRAAGLSICGVDLISTDITRPWHENGAAINELNFMPQFRWSDREAEAARAPHALVANGGRIPVHIVCAEDSAVAHAAALRARMGNGAPVHLTTATHSEGPDGAIIPMAQDTLLERGVALLMHGDVEGLILAGSSAEMLASGFAVDRADSVLIIAPDGAEAERIAAGIALHIEVGTVEIADCLPA